MDLTELLKRSDDHVKTELSSAPEVVDVTDFDPVEDVPPITARRWFRVADAVVVVADLVGSTKLGIRKHASSTASIYEAALRPVVDIYREFGAGHISVQGDCVIGIFWDDMAMERAMCAAITTKTFSRSLAKRLDNKWKDEDQKPKTGFKVGVAASSLLVKRIGLAQTPHKGLVWPGKAVNYAVKAAQTADAHELVVTGGVWDAIADNDYMRYSCGHGGGDPSHTIWHDHHITKLDHDDVEASGRMLTSAWCEHCGEEFCNAILDGERRRSIPQDVRTNGEALTFKTQFASRLAKKRAEMRQRTLSPQP